MKIRLVKNLVCGCLLSVIIVLGISMCEGHGKKEATGTSDSVLKSKKYISLKVMLKFQRVLKQRIIHRIIAKM